MIRENNNKKFEYMHLIFLLFLFIIFLNNEINKSSFFGLYTQENVKMLS